MSPKVSGLAFDWSSIPHIGQIQSLKVSYPILFLAPIYARFHVYIHIQFGFTTEFPFTLKLTFFSALFLSLAHMVFQAFCPYTIKRFESSADMYRDMLNTRTSIGVH